MPTNHHSTAEQGPVVNRASSEGEDYRVIAGDDVPKKDLIVTEAVPFNKSPLVGVQTIVQNRR